MGEELKVLIVVKAIDGPGGVGNFYRILNLQRIDGIDYFFTKNRGWWLKKVFRFLFIYYKFYKKIKKYDIIHINPSLGNTATWRDIVFLWIAKMRNKKVIAFFHGWNDNIENKIKKKRLLRNIFLQYNKIDAFFVSGTIFKNKLISMGISEKKTFYLETMIADDRYLCDFSVERKIEDFKSPNTPLRFLFISRFASGKGMKLAIDIFNKLQNKTDISMELIMAGDGDLLQETKEYVLSNKINNIVFPGYVRDKAKHDLYVKSHITLFPTMYGEGIPNTVLEGMLYGMPIISRVNAGIPDWVINDQNGYILQSTEPDDFVPLIEKIIFDKQLYEKISRNNYNKAKNNFVKDVIEARFLKHYLEIFKNNN